MKTKNSSFKLILVGLLSQRNVTNIVFMDGLRKRTTTTTKRMVSNEPAKFC